jgi:adenosylhomocysteine nucleosidase
MSDRVLIMSALAEESSLLGEAMTDVEITEVGGHEFRLGSVGSRPVVTTAAGIGKVNAAMVTTLAVDHFHPSAMLVTGVAGGLDETLQIGDIVIGERVLHHDTGVVEPEGFHLYQSGHVPFVNPTDRLGYFPSTDLLDRVRLTIPHVHLSPVLGREPRIVFGTIATGDQFVNAEIERRRLFDRVGALVVEMEGSAVAQVADHFGIDHLVIRAVSDLAGNNSAIDFFRFLDEVAANSVRIVTTLLHER